MLENGKSVMRQKLKLSIERNVTRVLPFIIICFIILTLFVVYFPGTISGYIKNETGIAIPKGVDIQYNDSHGGFLGDGVFFATIKLGTSETEKVLKQISRSKKWKPLPINIYDLDYLLYGGKNQNTDTKGRFADEVALPPIQNGYWFFLDRFSGASNTGESIVSRNSYNFTYAVFDTDSNILYVVLIDT